VLAAFKNLLRAASEAEILAALADAAVSDLGADGAAVVRLLPSGEARMVESRGLPEAVAGFCPDVDVIDAELGDRLLAACAGQGGLARATTFPMMSGGDLFGALVLCFTEARPPTPEGFHTAEAFCDLAGISLGKARQYEELHRSLNELRASREVLQRTEKLRSLGEMAAGISHDLKNILNPLSLHLQLLKRILKRSAQGAPPAPPAGALEAIAEMEQVLRRGVDTIERLRDFSRQSPEARLESVRLDALAHEATELARPRIAALRRPRGVRLVEHLGAPPPILARSSELVAALLNVIVNSIDVLTDGGTVTVSTGAGDGGAWVKVHDDGSGIPEEIRNRIFEPFFTTKGKEGTGLGLAMVYAFVQRHAGKLSLDSPPGHGTTFTLWFPAASSSTP
jgi:signal transduction histidine kinase